MPIYQIERISRDTGMAKKELESAPFLAIAFLQQEMKHGKDYIYKLVGRLENGKIVSDEPDHNTVNRDQLHRFHQYIKSNSENSHPKSPTSSLTLHNLAYLRYMIEGKSKDPDMAPYTDTTSHLTSTKQARLRKLLQNSRPRRGGII